MQKQKFETQSDIYRRIIKFVTKCYSENILKNSIPTRNHPKIRNKMLMKFVKIYNKSLLVRKYCLGYSYE